MKMNNPNVKPTQQDFIGLLAFAIIAIPTIFFFISGAFIFAIFFFGFFYMAVDYFYYKEIGALKRTLRKFYYGLKGENRGMK